MICYISCKKNCTKEELIFCNKYSRLDKCKKAGSAILFCIIYTRAKNLKFKIRGNEFGDQLFKIGAGTGICWNIYNVPSGGACYNSHAQAP